MLGYFQIYSRFPLRNFIHSIICVDWLVGVLDSVQDTGSAMVRVFEPIMNLKLIITLSYFSTQLLVNRLLPNGSDVSKHSIASLLQLGFSQYLNLTIHFIKKPLFSKRFAVGKTLVIPSLGR